MFDHDSPFLITQTLGGNIVCTKVYTGMNPSGCLHTTSPTCLTLILAQQAKLRMKMLLAIDVGNSQTVIGCHDGKTWVAQRRLTSEVSRTADELRSKLAELFSLVSDNLSLLSEPSCVKTVVISSVVPQLTLVWEQLAATLTGAHVITIGPGVKTGMAMKVKHPHEVGADRIADAIAAAEKYGTPVTVVDFGTATTINIVNTNGEFLGGVISPGVETSATALFSKAARLSAVDLEAPVSALGTDTQSAMQSGLIFGEAAKIDGLIERIFSELGYETQLIATGGLCTLIVPHCAHELVCDETLTLEGLRLIAERTTEL